MPDKFAKVDAAIAKVDTEEAEAAAPTGAWFDIALLNNQNRMAKITVPVDVSDMELLHLIGNVLGIGDRLRASRKPSSGILVPQHVNRELANRGEA